ncbi:hypothetical protein PISL3812_07062 [Talaromyces islandicus]|uniref:Uncharacterized protein n=1 Tax=Talaromyces islandicus TaxID=28573 RepID=A0A0U1M4S2_TALIS|nr:hypothetical protein PISL3812_07062 [Talaromyces islandicus]
MVHGSKRTKDYKDTNSSVVSGNHDQESATSETFVPVISPSDKINRYFAGLEIQEPRTGENESHTEHGSHEVQDEPGQRETQQPRTLRHQSHAEYSHYEGQSDWDEMHVNPQAQRYTDSHREGDDPYARGETRRHESRREPERRERDHDYQDELERRANHKSQHKTLKSHGVNSTYGVAGAIFNRNVREAAKSKNREKHGRHGDHSSVSALEEPYRDDNDQDKLEKRAKSKQNYGTLKSYGITSTYGVANAMFNRDVREDANSREPKKHGRQLTRAERERYAKGWGVIKDAYQYQKKTKDRRSSERTYPQSHGTSEYEYGTNGYKADIPGKSVFHHLPGGRTSNYDANGKKKIRFKMGNAAMEENDQISSMTTVMFTDSVFFVIITKNYSMLASVPSSAEEISGFVQEIRNTIKGYGIGIPSHSGDMYLIPGVYNNEKKSLVDEKRVNLFWSLLMAEPGSPWFGRIQQEAFFTGEAQRTESDFSIGIFPGSNGSMELEFTDFEGCKTISSTNFRVENIHDTTGRGTHS